MAFFQKATSFPYIFISAAVIVAAGGVLCKLIYIIRMFFFLRKLQNIKRSALRELYNTFDTELVNSVLSAEKTQKRFDELQQKVNSINSAPTIMDLYSDFFAELKEECEMHMLD